MKSYSILVPTSYNNGKSIPEHVFSDLEARMIRRFNGFTHNPTLLRGAYLSPDGTLYRDTLTTYTLFSDSQDDIFRFARIVSQTLDQECVSVIGADGSATFIYSKEIAAAA